MSTIKHYTDLSQSKVLAEILSLKSADMFYSAGNETQPIFRLHSYGHIMSDKDVPCWSLAALLKIIPDVVVSTMKENSNKWEIASWNGIDLDQIISIDDFDSPVDACYEMVLKLNELNRL